MALYLYAPTLVVSEVQLQGVELEACHLVDEQLYILYRDEMTGGVEHYGAETEAWAVVDAYVCNPVLGSVADVANEKLVKCLQGKEYGAFGGSFYKDAVFVYLQSVVLASGKVAVHFERDDVLAAFSLADAWRQAQTLLGNALQLFDDEGVAG